MIEFKKLESGYVEMYVDAKFIGVFPTEKRGRLFASGERDLEGNKIEKSLDIPQESESVDISVKADSTSGQASQNIGETNKKRRGRRKKVGLNDRGISL